MSTRHAFALDAALLLPGAYQAAGQSLPGSEQGGEVQLSELAVRMASMSAVTGYERAPVDTSDVVSLADMIQAVAERW